MQNAIDTPSFTEEAANLPFFCQSFSLISLGSCSLIQASLIIRTTIPFSSTKYLSWCLNSHQWWCIWSRNYPIAIAIAKSLQSCPTLRDPIDGSPPGSPVPGILQARTLEWVAISFSNAWKWKVKVKWLSRVQLLVTPWTAAYQAPPSMGFSRQEYWSGVPLPSPRNYPIALLFPFLSSLTRTWGVKHFAKTSGGDFWVRQMPGGQWMGCMCECTCCGDGRPWGTGRALSLRKERSRTPRMICQKGVEGDEQDPFILTGITWPWQGPQFLPSSGNRMLLKASLKSHPVGPAGIWQKLLPLFRAMSQMEAERELPSLLPLPVAQLVARLWLFWIHPLSALVKTKHISLYAEVLP